MDDDAKIAKAHRAAGELTETQEAFDKLRAGLIKEWSETALEAVAYREHLFLSVRTLDATRSILTQVVDTGRIAESVASMKATHG